jgi:hypothetical protein
LAAYEGTLSRVGPGLITGVADDDPSGIATYSQAGAQFGLNMLTRRPMSETASAASLRYVRSRSSSTPFERVSANVGLYFRETGIWRAETTASKPGHHIELIVRRDKVPPRNPANSGLLLGDQEISIISSCWRLHEARYGLRLRAWIIAREGRAPGTGGTTPLASR